MERIHWTEKAITFRDLVDNSNIQKPTLVLIGTKPIIVGEKINGQFLMASPCKLSNDRFNPIDQEFVLSSKHPGIWRVISKSTSKNEMHIHRVSTKHIENIHEQDIENKRTISRSYICTKDIEAFELIIRNTDPTIANGQRIERRIKRIEENVEFEITDIGEVEYTPSGGERTSQDYIVVPKTKPNIIQMFLPSLQEQVQLIRNRAIRALYCITKNESYKRRFYLEVNELACDIRPIASEGSTELRYLHSTQNLFDYMLNYGNDTLLYIKLLRGDSPIKSIKYDGYMVLKHTLTGNKIPICRVKDLEVTLVNPNLPVKVKLPTSEHSWRSLSEIRAAELQCMQLSLSLLARHESEMYVTVETEKSTTNVLRLNDHEEQQQRSSSVIRNHIEDRETNFNLSKQARFHPASDKLYRKNDEKQSQQISFKIEREQSQKMIIRDKPNSSSSSSSSSSNKYKTKTNII